MARKNTAVFGIYRNQSEVNEAVDALIAAGYRSADISVLFPDNRGTKDFAHEKNTKAPEGTAAGASSGLVLGGALGWLTGIGALAIPGVGPFIAAGPIVAALAGGGPGERLAVSLSPWSAWGSRNMKRSATKDVSERVACSCPSIAITPIGLAGPRGSCAKPEQKILAPRRKLPQTS